MSDDRTALIRYRLEQADQSLAAAHDDRSAERLREAINRSYYAMFYAGLALLVSKDMGTSKHAGLISLVSEHFIKSGQLPPHLGRALNQAFDLRQKADYREFFRPTEEQADQALAAAEEFVGAARALLEPLS